MPPKNLTSAARNEAPGGAFFTHERANRALVLVRPIVADLVARHRELTELRIEARALPPGDDTRDRQLLLERIDGCVARLDRLRRELVDVGVVLRDWSSGLVDFPAERQGRRVWLCWQLGEPEVSYWHELSDGFTGRRPVDAGVA